ncbi:(2E,6E)-farnesyl diphosphate synthase [Marinibactrum halimedae]|uniref:(2E,6E)-farnesyl diphosphate synthase n=1 Tax=Marinibactrum halimedae TaxID=1444977 RepID=A0AA37WN65_9GAMM|nr:farnesyl diphosphate synthase [Marinibactrum halimedae]MCD9461015.1 (2E,6E)-farnesyl diphosphate synthase [Marinibactrum halimedae]GLS27799.1 (2E,6E)-farnesyl diphosphate synthase [Marinibactrum halimedae]
MFEQFSKDSQSRVQNTLEHFLLSSEETHPSLLLDAMRYSALNGGKRVRPMLVYAAAEAIGNEDRGYLDTIAASIECIHAYSLIHDDLPAMDDDDLRRGQPTCHVKFGEANAILAGDALQTLAFEKLSTPQAVDASLQLRILHEITQASGHQGMVLGQAIDLAAINQSLTRDALERMHAHKTGALIKASVRCGALACRASENQLDALTGYANAIGLAFQVQDDVLDVTTDTETLGKPQGADAALNKPTFVSLLGLRGAQRLTKELHEAALNHLAGFDYRADYLRHLSGYIIQRAF